MKFEIKMGKDFDFQLGSHEIHVRFVPPEHRSLKHKLPPKSREELEREILQNILKRIETGKALNGALGIETIAMQATIDPTEYIVGDFGCFNSEEYTIYIRHPDNYSFQLSTFIHEMIHAIEHIYLIEFDHQHLNLVAEVLTQVLMVNFSTTKAPKSLRVPLGEEEPKPKSKRKQRNLK